MRFFRKLRRISGLAALCLLAFAANAQKAPPTPAAALPESYLPQLSEKKVGLVVNHTSRAGEQHLVDLLLGRGIAVKKIFAPEHGFRGKAGAGQHIEDGKDPQSGLPVISLYGRHKKPTKKDFAGLDILVFDIQDVGARFYTYISTMHYVMEACAEQEKALLVLDRPNPNGHYVDGPVLEPEYQSFVGMHPIPVVHGLTVGELARMINGEGWLADGQKVQDLSVAKARHYTHSTPYTLPTKPSPNLPNARSIRLYPSLCFLEGTPISVGRGTDFPFQAYGYPEPGFGPFQFTPEPNEGAPHPKFKGQTCYGYDLRKGAWSEGRLNLKPLLRCYRHYEGSKLFFKGFFDKLAGTDQLRKQIDAGKSAQQIRQSWQEDLAAYRQMREKYLLYPE